MVKKKGRPRLKWSLKDKEIVARYQGQIGLFGNVICRICGRSFPLDIMEVDHIKPISQGGTDQPSNLQLLCPACNRKKSRKKTQRTKVTAYNPLDFRAPIIRI